ncbi:MAG: PASTA domain-containing protein [Bergeyella sp.]|nr:PASTA domain-containing protein [Bergeyella sp.]
MLKLLLKPKLWLNILAMVIVFIGLVWLAFLWLKSYTRHGEEVAVPNIINMKVQDAVKVLDDMGLDYEVDSLKQDSKYKPYQVLQVWPSPGSRIKYGRIISIRVNPKALAKVTVPDVLDRYKGLVFRQLEQVNLKVGDTIYEPNIQKDAVIRLQLNGAEVKPGEQVPRYSLIDVVIGAGPKRNVNVPSVVGLTVSQAEKVIKNNLFEIGLVEYEDGAGDKSDVIYYQDPAAGALRDQGMQIDIWASKKEFPELSEKIEELNIIYRRKGDSTLLTPKSDNLVNFEN